MCFSWIWNFMYTNIQSSAIDVINAQGCFEVSLSDKHRTTNAQINPAMFYTIQLFTTWLEDSQGIYFTNEQPAYCWPTGVKCL